ncbi:MAG: hypothetical protein Q7J04_02760, partial [Microcella sp.]|nr:hypothetical protein [Microcella sp.]
PWTHTFIGAAFCPGTFPSTVAAAEMVMPDCDGNPGRVMLTNEGGVIWKIDGEVVAGNITHTVAPNTTITLTAELEGPTEENPGGWAWNDPEQQTEWVQAFPMPDDCSPELAFTGSSAMTSWIGLAAALLTLVGMGFVLRRHRVEA